MNFIKTKLEDFEDRVFTVEVTGHELLVIYAGIMNLSSVQANKIVYRRLGIRMDLGDIDMVNLPIDILEKAIKRNYGVE